MAVWSVLDSGELARRGRLDAEYFQPRYLEYERMIERLTYVTLGSVGLVTDGIHSSPDVVEENGVRYLSAKCVKDNDFSIGAALQISPKQDANNTRTRLRQGDVLLTTVGTIGNAAVVPTELLPANIDRHLGLIRLRPDAPIDAFFIATFLNTTFGRFQSLREATGNVQLNLFIEKIKMLKVPKLSIAPEISATTKNAYNLRQKAVNLVSSAEVLLLESLGLSHMEGSPSLFYEKEYCDLLNAHRFDAEYFSPRYQRALEVLARNGRCIGTVANLSERRFRPETLKSADTFQYIEIGSIRSDGLADSETVKLSEAPSRAQWVVEPDDIITSTVRPIRQLSALITPEQSGYVCSSGFAVLRPKHGAEGVEPEVLLTFLRLPIVCEILDLHTTASMYPAIATTRLMGIPFAVPKQSVRDEVVFRVRKALAARGEADRLLEKAKAEVERLVIGGRK